jgi:hypothetical protein
MKSVVVLSCILSKVWCFAIITQAPQDSLKNLSSRDSTSVIDSLARQSNRRTPENGDVTQSGEQIPATVKINVLPLQASDAIVTIVQTSTILVQPSVTSTTRIAPDTLSIMKAPLSKTLYPGEYQILAVRQGYRSELARLVIKDSGSTSLSINLLSLEYLQGKQETWRTNKWICAGIGVLAGGSTFYFNNRINASIIIYENASSPGAAQDARNRVNNLRTGYTISSAIAFAFIGGFILSWILESTYR